MATKKTPIENLLKVEIIALAHGWKKSNTAVDPYYNNPMSAGKDSHWTFDYMYYDRDWNWIQSAHQNAITILEQKAVKSKSLKLRKLISEAEGMGLYFESGDLKEAFDLLFKESEMVLKLNKYKQL